MHLRPTWLAAGAVLALLAGTYEAARHRPGRPLPPAEVATTTSLTTDTAAIVAAPGVAPGPAPAPPPAPALAPGPAPAPEPGPPNPASWEFRRSQQLTERPRRYVGTVGGQPATAVLYPGSTDSTRGYFYRWPRAELLTLCLARRPRAGWQVANDYRPPYGPQGHWRLDAAPDTLLRGVWVGPTGRRQPFRLRESYQGAVRYEVVAETYATRRRPEQGGLEHTCDFLHLLGPAAAHQPLSRLQWPGPAARRRYVLGDREAGDQWHRSLEVALNDFNLLSYSTFAYASHYHGASDNGEYASLLFDLTTGRELTLASQLRPRYEYPLRRLLTRALARDPDQQARNQIDGLSGRFQPADHERYPHLAPLPYSLAEGCTLEADGLRVEWSECALYEGGFCAYRRTTFLSYPELRPLVRPGTPLAAMLAARGLC